LIEQHYSGPLGSSLSSWCSSPPLGWWSFANRHVPYDNQLWWEFAFEASAPRSLRASLFAGRDCGGRYGLWRCCGRRSRRRRLPRDADLERVETLITDGRRQHRQSCAARRQGPCCSTRSARPFIMYQEAGHSWVAMGEPGRSDRGPANLWLGEFSGELRYVMGGLRRCFYQVKPQKSALVHRSRV